MADLEGLLRVAAGTAKGALDTMNAVAPHGGNRVLAALYGGYGGLVSSLPPTQTERDAWKQNVQPIATAATLVVSSLAEAEPKARKANRKGKASGKRRP